jgi:hypothetical protein
VNVKTINKRVEDLENGQSPLKPILILWGDENNDAICRVDDAGQPLGWDNAIERFSQNHTVICVRYVDDWRADAS